MSPIAGLELAVAPPQPRDPKARRRIDLASVWERHDNGKLFDTVQVPSSLRPLGFNGFVNNFCFPDF